MDFGAHTLVAVRALATVAAMVAGVAALRTDGAFRPRTGPPPWWLRRTPFARTTVTKFGVWLLLVILMVPILQFGSDWIKDIDDSITQDQLETTLETRIGGAMDRAINKLNKALNDTSQQSLDAIQATAKAVNNQNPQFLQLQEAINSVNKSLPKSYGNAKAPPVVSQKLVKAIQQVQEQAPELNKILSGWIFLGRVDKTKLKWEKNSPMTVNAVALPMPISELLLVRDDVYIRKEISPDLSKPLGDVMSAALSGQRFRVLDILYRPTKTDGFCVWAKVEGPTASTN
jgi:hypothetical protein